MDGYKKHPNGGGWVADTATVADTAYVGPMTSTGRTSVSVKPSQSSTS